MATVTICGGGNAAHVLIPLAHAAGWEVNVYAPYGDEAERLRQGMARNGGLRIRFEDGREIVGRAHRTSGDPAQVIPGAGLILLALPAFAHGPTLEAIAPHLDDDALIGALPARGGFDYQAEAILRRAGKTARFFGLQTLPWACRTSRYGEEVTVLGTKAVVDLAAFPASESRAVAELLTGLLQLPFHAISSFLALTLANTGQIIHPGIMYGLCYGREEATYSRDEIPHFYQGVDGFTAEKLQAMSDDVQRVAAVLATAVAEFEPADVLPLYDWVCRAYAGDIADESTLASAFVTNQAYAGLRVPARPTEDGRYRVDFTARYLAEDVPYGLVVVRGIARLAGVAIPALDSVIKWAEERLNHRYLDGDSYAGSRAPQVFGMNKVAQLAESHRAQLER
ncbi:MAG: NAD/NADP octopine/nopaline dehydrogenase family protein [Anaerolineae bacterium]|nr:NAD/NADP octopine/nopaline dehydrogenase family protein [Anaerolineae bacterium]